MSSNIRSISCFIVLWISGFTAVLGQQFPEGFLYGGVCGNHYFHGLAPMDVYINDINREKSPADPFRYMTNAPGILLGINEEKLGVEFSRVSATSKANYTFTTPDNTSYTVDEKLRVINSQLKVYYIVPVKQHFYLGSSIDFGVIRNNRKQSGDGFSGKWEKFYTSTGLVKDYKSTDMMAGLGIRVGFVMSHIHVMASTQFLFMDATFDGYAGKRLKMNSQHIQLSLSYAFYE